MRTLGASIVCLLLVLQAACVSTETEPVKVSLDDAAKGVLTNLGGFASLRLNTR